MRCLFYLFVLMTVDSQYVGIPRNYSSFNPCTDRSHLFLAPGVLTAGGSNRACVSRFHADGTARLLLTLLTEDRQTITVSRELPPGDGGCIDISVPQLPNTRADLIVNLRYPEAQCTWDRRITLRVSSGRVVAVHTERARYRPGDTVRARVFVLKPDLTPVTGVIDEIWVEGPRGAWEGARAAQWLRVRSRLGVAQVQYPLDELAPPGQWAVRVRMADGSQGSAAFHVGNYELPPFQLSVRHAPRVLRSSERLVWTVCVRYPWTEAVEGMLVIRIRGAGTPTSDGANGIRTAVRLKAPRACHRHAAAARRIGLGGSNSPDVVVADFSFQEEGTRVWQNTTVVSQVVDRPLTLEFLTKHRAVISAGLPYKLKIKATRWDDKPATNERIRVCRSPANHASDLTQVASARFAACDDALTDAAGVAHVLFSAGHDGSAFYRLQATLHNDSTVSTPPLYLPVQRRGVVHAALGPLKPDMFATRTFVPLFLNLRNITRSITVHFVVITRGGIIYRWGATTQCPFTSSGNQIQTAARNILCNANLARIDDNTATFDNNALRIDRNTTKREKNKRRFNYNAYTFDGYAPFHRKATNLDTDGARQDDDTANFDETEATLDRTAVRLDANESDTLLDRHMLRVMLPIKVTQQMCPDSHLVAYFYYNGELVSASKYFEMDECFGNKVEATWQSRQTPPGSLTTLQLTTPGPAVCALTALDSAAKWVQPGQNVRDVVISGLRRLMDNHRNLTEYDTARECFLTADTPDLPTTSMELTATWLAAAGVRILGGEPVRNRVCQKAPLALTAEDVVPRSDFSEAWLWRLVAVGANGSAVTSARAPDSITRFEASAVCVSRTGMAISAPAVLQVFREFFIHADSPKRLRRGDNSIIRYRLFNYLYEPLSVQIQLISDQHLEILSERVEAACLPARASLARRVEVRARGPGDARFSVRAKSVSDGRCGNASRSEVSDEVVIQITIDPEGVPMRDEKSILLCAKGSSDSSTSDVSWFWPKVDAVPGTESLTFWAISDITGPLLADADDLVMLPRGCGEQNMARLATNLLALKHLDPRSTAAFTAKEHVARGFTRQLQYIHPSGGFSAFGASDSTPSTWLTAFAVRYLRRALQVLTPGLPQPPALERAEQWLLSQQMENGCFRNEGQVFHRELRGGLNEDGEIASVALTAYVITSLMESSITLPSRVLRNSLSCLRALPPLKSKNPARIYAHSLLAYAFMRMREYEEVAKGQNEASLLDSRERGLERDEETRELMELLKLARRSSEFVWWETGSLSTSIEATSYALLALSLCPLPLRAASCSPDARGAVRWLAAQRGARGGFQATQDTLVALEALTSWSSVQSSPADLNVTVQGYGGGRTVSVHTGMKVPEVLKMGDGGKISVNVEGEGCALIQATRSYHSYVSDDAPDKQLSVQVSVHTDGPFNCDGNGTSCFCAAVIEACVVWAGEFPEMALLEVALPGGFRADASLLYSQLQHSNTLLRRIELTPSSSRATLYLGPPAGAPPARGGHQCCALHATGPRAATRAAAARLWDYYRPQRNHTQMYTIPEDCPPRIVHESNKYLASDNLFKKAKFFGSEEMDANHEFAFGDIPEGIPLEDPLYDNLKAEQKDNVDTINEMQALSNKSNGDNHTDTVKKLSPNANKLIKIDDKLANVNDDSKETDNRNLDLKSSQIYTLDRHNDVKEQSINVNSKEFDNNKNKEDLNTTQSSESTVKEEPNERESKANLNIISAEDKLNTTNSESHNEITIPTERIDQQIEIRNEPIELGDQEKAETDNRDSTTANVEKENLKLDTNNVNKEVENPNLSEFHVIDTEKDLDVPEGIEGPVPSVVLPPPLLDDSRGYPPRPWATGMPYATYTAPWSRPAPTYQRRVFQTRILPLSLYRPLPAEDMYWRNTRLKRIHSPIR